ncbi:hypothetical protein [Paracoccus laeviglucosivorans]|uniref:UrcA family protein n=1 Tax=Paracoccus laeviglucosivorans TaxID=1197861 RepID=A0A521FU74_9RHOB|nr:hypothetical protein [Paracoccus laeviglucosivorans]SMO99091.1 hypothetical protein SAMN06265221_14015 [Paracoccus laeviglucosivorans]
MKPLISAIFMALLPAVSHAQALRPQAVAECLPPEEPFVPSSDAELRHYANLVAADFERYFGALTDYLACLDATRLASFQRAHEISRQHRAFRARLDQLGLAGQAAIAHPPISSDGDPP